MPIRDFVGILRFRNEAGAALSQAEAQIKKVGVAAHQAQVQAQQLAVSVRSIGGAGGGAMANTPGLDALRTKLGTFPQLTDRSTRSLELMNTHLRDMNQATMTGKAVAAELGGSIKKVGAGVHAAFGPVSKLGSEFNKLMFFSKGVWMVMQGMVIGSIAGVLGSWANEVAETRKKMAELNGTTDASVEGWELFMAAVKGVQVAIGEVVIGLASFGAKVGGGLADLMFGPEARSELEEITERVAVLDDKLQGLAYARRVYGHLEPVAANIEAAAEAELAALQKRREVLVQEAKLQQIKNQEADRQRQLERVGDEAGPLALAAARARELELAQGLAAAAARELSRTERTFSWSEAKLAVMERELRLRNEAVDAQNELDVLSAPEIRTLAETAGMRKSMVALMQQEFQLDIDRMNLQAKGQKDLRDRVARKSEEIAQTRALEEAERRGAFQSETWGESFKHLRDEARPAFEEFAKRPIEFRKIWISTLDSIQGGLTTFFDKLMQGTSNMKSLFKDLGRSIVASFRQTIAQMASQQVMQRFAAGAAGYFPGMAQGAQGGAAGGAAGAGGVGGFGLGSIPGLGGMTAMRGLGLAAGAAVAYQGYQQGNIAQGAAGGALAGYMLAGAAAGPIGIAVGAVVGAVAGALGRDKRKAAKKKARRQERQSKYQRIQQLQSEAQNIPEADRLDAMAALESALRYLNSSRVGNSPGNWAANMQGADAGIAEAEAVILHSRAKRMILNSIRANFGGGAATLATVRANAALLSGGLSRAETSAVLQRAASGGGGGGGGGGGVDVGGVNVVNNITATIAADIDIQNLADRLGAGVVEQFISAIPAI